MTRLWNAAIADVVAERQRQIEAEGWTDDHDDQHCAGELSTAASAYTQVASAQVRGASAEEFPADLLLQDGIWPWDEKWWKPGDARRNLVKAGALILAEIERLDRMGPNEKFQGPAR